MLDRVVFSCLSKVIWNYFGFFYYAIFDWFRKTRHPFNQSDEKLTTNVTVTCMFTRDFPRFKQLACFEFPLVPCDFA